MKASTTTLRKSPTTKRTAAPWPITGKRWNVLGRVVLLPEDVGDHRELDDAVGEDAGVILLQLSLAGAASAGVDDAPVDLGQKGNGEGRQKKRLDSRKRMGRTRGVRGYGFYQKR